MKYYNIINQKYSIKQKPKMKKPYEQKINPLKPN